ncbi:helix-turn-helix domain-containing protein [Sphingomonas sp. R86521]|jgi:transcriptional regulator with XRE-family HTH domain|uniref:helix-turn-helix domain-containing protein n=1 Tax=Sphingomonas sp. R86521 TaxID=3093860 RepID=UPI0036D219FE
MDVRKRLGTNVRRLREAAGYSQEAFGDAANIHRTYVSDVERGRRNPTIEIVEKFAVALKVRTGSLLDDPADLDGKA